MPPGWLWIVLTIWASFAQTLRNAAQRALTAEAGTLGATLSRFLFGLPFAVTWLLAILAVEGFNLPSVNATFLFWVSEAAIAQIVATAFLLRVMEERNFTVGVAYSQTSLVQVAVFATLFLGDPATLLSIIAIFMATLGVLLFSPGKSSPNLRALVQGWTSRGALMGVLSGSAFAFASVGYRGAALELDDASFTLAAAYTLVWAQAMQTVVLGLWLLFSNAAVIFVLFRAWRTSLAAGFMGAAASVGWFTAMAIEPVAHVRTLGLVELFFSLAAANRLFSERLGRTDLVGLLLLSVALVLIASGG